MLGSLCVATYLANASNIAITPFLLEIARDLDTDLAALGTLLGLGSVTWAITGVFAGAASDRFGRRPVMLVGLIGLATFPLGLAATGVYAAAVVFRLIGGVGGGCFTGSAMAAAAESVPTTSRGRALGWIVTGQSLATVIGVPMVALIGTFIGWRNALMMQGIAVAVAAVLVWLAVSSRSRGNRPEQLPARDTLRLLTPRVLAILSANALERFCYGGVSVFLATYLLTSYAVSLEIVALALALSAAGTSSAMSPVAT